MTIVDNSPQRRPPLCIAGQIYDGAHPLVKTPPHFFSILWKIFRIFV